MVSTTKSYDSTPGFLAVTPHQDRAAGPHRAPPASVLPLPLRCRLLARALSPQVSMGTPPYIAMTLGDKVVTIMDYSGVYKEEGFFIPLD